MVAAADHADLEDPAVLGAVASGDQRGGVLGEVLPVAVPHPPADLAAHGVQPAGAEIAVVQRPGSAVGVDAEQVRDPVVSRAPGGEHRVVGEGEGVPHLTLRGVAAGGQGHGGEQGSREEAGEEAGGRGVGDGGSGGATVQR